MGIKFTKAGIIYIILTIFMGFSAINTNNNLVFIVVSFMLAVMGISGFLGKRNIEKLSFNIYAAEDIYAKRGARFILEVKNLKRFLPSILINVKLNTYETSLIYINPLSASKTEFSLYFDKRGRNTIKELTVSSPFPFNFFIRYKIYALNEEVIVFPEIGEKSLLYLIDENGTEIENRNEKITLKLEELSNIRSYSNDPAKRIFWKQFAKTGELYTKEYTGEDTQSLVIHFEDIVRENKLEDALKIATKTIIDAYNSSINLTFIIKEKIFHIRNESEKRSALKELALYGD